MTISEKIKEIEEKNALIARLKSEILDSSNGLFDEFREYIFCKYPMLESFCWTQYTPYFNDGDSTIFSVNTEYILINGEPAENSDWFYKNKIINWGEWNGQLKSYEGRVEEPNLNYNQILVDAHNEITSFLANFDEDFYLNRFGDHAEITVTKSNVDISDYDHE